MAELATVARPYAEAAFQSALEGGRLEPAAESLAMVAAISRDERLRSALSNPKVGAAQKKGLFRELVGERLDPGVGRLIDLLVDNHREALLGEIATQFDELKREQERVVQARITSAQPLTDAQRAEIVSALETRHGKRIEVEIEVDPELLGGARVQIGDQVIHASVRDALGQMAAALTR